MKKKKKKKEQKQQQQQQQFETGEQENKSINRIKGKEKDGTTYV